jgi:class 3 adenylate cyclase
MEVKVIENRFGFAVHFLYLIFFGYLGVYQLALFNIISTSAWFLAMVINRNGHHIISMLVLIVEVCLHQTLCVIFIGWGSGFQYYLLIIPIGIYLAPTGYRFLKLSLMAICFVNISLLDYYFRGTIPFYVLNSLLLGSINYVNIFFVVTVMGLVCFFFNYKVNTAEAALRIEQLKLKDAYSLLSKYVAPQLSDTITTGQIDLIWKHNRRKLTLFFSDIKDFTLITDSMEPEDMATLLNEYLTEMNLLINKYGGTLAQVIGDALYVFFGAPKSTDDKDHAIRCVKMAIDMQNKMSDLNKKWFDMGIDVKLEIRCGINTGMATVGGYGSSERKEYTAMGMQTNIAARLEQSCEPGGILISKTTWALVKDKISCFEKGKINVKGIQKQITVYSVATDAS